MSLFQCENCGCRENTALALQGFNFSTKNFDWSSAEGSEGQRLCSACGPSKYKSGELTGYGVWHGKFERKYLDKGMYRTDCVGNLERIDI